MRILALLACAVVAQAQHTAFVHVTVIDVELGRARPDMTVLVSGDRIARVAPARAVRLPRGTDVIDGRGKFLIPGLWDMHVHMHATFEMDERDTSGESFFAPRFLANGITGVRSMFDSLAAMERLRASSGLRIVASGPIVDGPRPYWPGSIACGTPEAGRAAVQRLKSEGADFIKVYSLLPPEVYLAIADEAKKAGIPFSGHVPNSVGVAGASDAGQKSVEHLFGPPESYTPELLAKLVKNGTWVAPTLSVLYAASRLGTADLPDDHRTANLPPVILQFWKQAQERGKSQDAAARAKQFEGHLRIVREMHGAGVRVLAGTDTPNPYVYPGSSLHDELGLLVKAGLSPLEALRAATSSAAEYLGKSAGFGSVGEGKAADLVLLDGDPLADIANTRRIRAVMLRGKISNAAPRPPQHNEPSGSQ
jgi:imidazolonepropionase-like amidohydrolase